jgi:mannose/cellobiose epimerase-like protein (N-acyl-D-glucosamine 2-epimerase family)
MNSGSLSLRSNCSSSKVLINHFFSLFHSVSCAKNNENNNNKNKNKTTEVRKNEEKRKGKKKKKMRERNTNRGELVTASNCLMMVRVAVKMEIQYQK